MANIDLEFRAVVAGELTDSSMPVLIETAYLKDLESVLSSDCKELFKFL